MKVTFIIFSLYSYGFVSYSTVEEANKAADSLNDTVLDGRALYINFDLRGKLYLHVNHVPDYCLCD